MNADNAETMAHLKTEKEALSWFPEALPPANLDKLVLGKLEGNFNAPLKVSDCARALTLVLLPLLAALAWQTIVTHDLPVFSPSYGPLRQFLPSTVLEAAGTVKDAFSPVLAMVANITGPWKLISALLSMSLVVISGTLPLTKTRTRRNL